MPNKAPTDKHSKENAYGEILQIRLRETLDKKALGPSRDC